MMTLLDTCVLSELYHPAGAIHVKQAVAALSPEEIYLSVITIGEISKGIALLAEGQRKRDLLSWLTTIKTTYSNRVLAIDTEVAMIWGDITARAQQKGIVIPSADGLIAATALRHNLRIMTRNVKDFQETGVRLLNPWEA